MADTAVHRLTLNTPASRYFVKVIVTANPFSTPSATEPLALEGTGYGPSSTKGLFDTAPKIGMLVLR